jgi:hypothetical protein
MPDESAGTASGAPVRAETAPPGERVQGPTRRVCVHGHFYQPPRENPWLEAVEVEDSAQPHHDWNARVTAECYAPNGASRVLEQAWPPRRFPGLYELERDGVCYTMRTYVMAREERDSDATRLVRYTKCLPAWKLQYKTAVAEPANPDN